MTSEEYLALESYMLRSCKNIGLVLLDEPLFKAYIEETQRQRKEANSANYYQRTRRHERQEDLEPGLRGYEDIEPGLR